MVSNSGRSSIFEESAHDFAATHEGGIVESRIAITVGFFDVCFMLEEKFNNFKMPMQSGARERSHAVFLVKAIHTGPELKMALNPCNTSASDRSFEKITELVRIIPRRTFNIFLFIRDVKNKIVAEEPLGVLDLKEVQTVGGKRVDSNRDGLSSEDARAKGANILMGGRRNPDLSGLYYEPTVITGVDNSMDIMLLETFGPVLCIQKVDNENEAIALANDSEFGLNGNVWTKDKDKGYRLAAAIDTGACSVNDMAVSYGIPAAPFGGKKNSGLGQVNGKKGLRGYCHEMPIVIDRFGGKMQNGYPYSAKSAEGMKKLMNFLWVKTSLGRWLS